MKLIRKAFLLSMPLVFVFASSVLAGGYQYKVSSPHLGGDVTPTEAYEMLKKDPDHTFLIDCRTRPEYQLIGHPEGAYLIPLKFWSGKLGEKKYGRADNPNFGKDLLARFNPKTDTLIFI